MEFDERAKDYGLKNNTFSQYHEARGVMAHLGK